MHIRGERIMTNEQAVKVLEMIEAHGSLAIQAKEKAIQALKFQEAYEKSIEEIRSLPQVWEEGAGINKCLNIIDKYLNRGV